MVGEGTFSKVYKARHKQSQLDFALKCVIPTIKPSRIIPELRYLRDMGGDSNIIEVKTCLFSSGYTIIVMPYFQHDRFSDYIKDMSLDEMKDYMCNLLIALRKVHQGKIIHRDVKPNNFLYNRSERKFALVDFGLAQYEADVLKASKTINRIQNNHLNHTNLIKKSQKSSKHQSQQENINSSKITANTLFKTKISDKVVCVRKRILTENDDENESPKKFKRLKHESPLKQNPFVYKAMMNMTNLPSTPTTFLDLNNSYNQTQITPLNFNAIPNFNFNSNFDLSSKLLTPENSSLVSNYQLNSNDPFKTPTKHPAASQVLSQIQNSPNSMIIPETPPKSSNIPDSFNSNSKKKVSALNFNRLNSSTFATPNTNVQKSKSEKRSGNQASLSSSLSNISLNCKCFGLDQICRICTKRNECMAPRAGTPGSSKFKIISF